MKNLIGDLGGDGWSCFCPEGQQVHFSLSDAGAKIETAKGRFGLGKWIYDTAILGGRSYDFSVEVMSSLAEEDLYVLLTQWNAEGKMIIREHAHGAEPTERGHRFYEKIDADAECIRLRVELWVKGDGAVGTWCQPVLNEGEPILSRRVRVAPIHIKHPGKTREMQIKTILSATDRAARLCADIVILGEGVLGRGLGLSLCELAENAESEMALLLRGRARRHRMYIVYNTVEAAEDGFFNTSFLFGRDGELVGKYRKTHLPVTELESGLAPGNEYPVFDLDFGRVGLLICYDQFFPQALQVLADRGAELICIPSAGDMHHCCFARAMERGVYLAVAGMNNENRYGWGATRVINPLGEILAETDTDGEIAFCEIDLAKRVRRHWMSTGPALSDVHDDYRFEKNSHSFEFSN